MRIKRPFIVVVVTFGIILPVILIIINSGRLFKLDDGSSKWRSDQIKIIQYLYPAARCVKLAEDNQIEIDQSYKADLEKYTAKLFQKLDTSRLWVNYLGQLVWLSDHYGFGRSAYLLQEMQKHYYDEIGLFTFESDEMRAMTTEKDAIWATCETYRYLKHDRNHLKHFNVNDGLSRFLAKYNHEESGNDEQIGWATLWEVASILEESGNEDMVPWNKVVEVAEHELNDDFYQDLMNGKYSESIAMIGVANSLSDYMIRIRNNTGCENLGQQIYEELDSEEECGYYKDDPLFVLYFAMIQDAEDLKGNEFICSNYSNWLTENYHTSIENILISALGD